MNESNGMALIVGTARAFEAEDAQRKAELDRWLAKEPDRDPTDGLCTHGHPLDGVKYDARRGSTRRFCRTCHKLEQRRRRGESEEATKPCAKPVELGCFTCGAGVSPQNWYGLCLRCVARTPKEKRPEFHERHMKRTGRSA